MPEERKQKFVVIPKRYFEINEIVRKYYEENKKGFGLKSFTAFAEGSIIEIKDNSLVITYEGDIAFSEKRLEELYNRAKNKELEDKIIDMIEEF